MNRRRFLLTSLAGVAVSPLVPDAQPAGKVYRIGYLAPSSPSDPERLASPFGERGLAAFRQGLRDLGYVEGQNIAFENRWAEGRFERLPDLAAELVRLKVDVIVSVVTQATLAVKNATRTIPIVMVAPGDPLGSGLVASLARPGGNVTGPSSMYSDLVGKQLEVLKEIVAKLSRVAVLWNPANAAWQAQMLKATGIAARALGLQVQLLEARGSRRAGGGVRGDDQRARQRAARRGGRDLCASRKTDRRPRSEAPPASDVRVERARRGRWPHVLRAEHPRCVPARRHVRGQDSEGRETWRSSLPTVHEFELVVNMKTAKRLD
jgi:hypothetical protein